MQHIFSVIVLAMFLIVSSGCATLQNASAGQIGCNPEDITIERDSGYLNFTGQRVWTAVCKGKRFICTEAVDSHGSSSTSCKEEIK